MACCILIAATIGAVLAVKIWLVGGRNSDQTIAALAWRLRAED